MYLLPRVMVNFCVSLDRHVVLRHLVKHCSGHAYGVFPNEINI